MIPRRWFVNGRLLKYNFVFKGLNIDKSEIDRIVRDSKKNRKNLSSKKMLNTYNLNEKMLFKIEIGISYNGIVYEIDSVDLKTEWVTRYLT